VDYFSMLAVLQAGSHVVERANHLVEVTLQRSTVDAHPVAACRDLLRGGADRAQGPGQPASQQ
jgi:hypothetical protein